MIWLVALNLALLLMLTALTALLVRRERAVLATAQQVDRLRRRVAQLHASLDAVAASYSQEVDTPNPPPVAPSTGDGLADAHPPSPPALTLRPPERRAEIESAAGLPSRLPNP